MNRITLRTFQPLARAAHLAAGGSLVGSWAHVPVPFGAAYRAMVDAMGEAGVSTGGYPPVWAWWGRLRLFDATALFNPEHELSTGYATVEFEAPAQLVVPSDYGVWNDYLDAVFENRVAATGVGVHRTAVPLDAEKPTQVCLPYVRASWVRDIRPLPTSGWDDLDPLQPV
ncbi:hypothetical protein [Amycolatopsis samaneae]|uniref:GyrI-like small molecule binding domain-containing protein n=1 Tax=Amycolatopsis samaneae TaxID=664691 RepID=A0ABW5GUB7_9PSEU